jgi:hypothetical protein
MKLILNIILFFCIAIMVLQNHLIIAGILALLFTFRCGAVWLLLLAFLIDGYFGAFSSMPVFSLGMLVWYVVSEIIRPQLLLQYESYGKTS